jgi:biopolymer transport protein ExbB/biopolymer transport protein TolQ
MLMQKLVLVAPLVANVVLYLLLALSVLSIGIIFERWWYFRKRRVDIEPLAGGLRKALQTNDLAAARDLMRDDPSIEAAIILEALEWYRQGPEAVEQIVARAIRARRKHFEGGLVFLGTLGNNAPFIGLFGTVLGIVTAFKELGATTGTAAGAAGGMNNVMSAIAEALIATGIGILVALPAVVAYNVFQKKGSDVEENANGLGNVMLASLKSEGGPPVDELDVDEDDGAGRPLRTAEAGA